MKDLGDRIKSAREEAKFLQLQVGVALGVSDKTILSWRKSLTPTLLSVLRNNADDEDINPSQIRKVVRNVINSVEFPTLSYQDNLTDEKTKNESTNSGLRSATGTLTKSCAESFLDEAKDYVNSLKQRVSSDIDLYLDDLISTLKTLEMSDEIFSEYDAQLEELEKQIENHETTLDEYNKLNKAITGVQ